MNMEKEFNKKEEKTKELTNHGCAQAYPVYWLGVEVVLKVVDLLQKEISMNENNKTEVVKYNKAYLVLLSRSIQHAESMRILVENGLYGDCFPLSRNLLSNFNMMQYLHYHPEFLDLFLSERQDDYQKNKEFRAVFREDVIERDLMSRGVQPMGGVFHMLSKTSHASYFGAQLYWTKDHKSGLHNLKYGPAFEPEKALLLSNLFSATHYDHINLILWHRHHAKEEIETEGWFEVREKLKDLKLSAEKFSKAALAAVNILWPNRDRGKIPK